MIFNASVEPRSADALTGILTSILDAQLIRRADETEIAFWFKHALIQDTVYTSLLRNDRRRLHRLVAETLEQLNPERVNEIAPRLAEHFEESGETARALFYLERAAENAAAQYANHEALDFYTRALDAAAALPADTLDSLYRARGEVYERIGKFDQAIADLENALRISRKSGDAHAEWQSLIALGFAWLARDYARAGEYFEKALELARAGTDRTRLAQSLNRAGNWYLNNGEPQRALTFHAEALDIFRAIGDVRGMAETEDFVGMTYFISANYVEGMRHSQIALAQFQAVGDPVAALNTRIAMQLQDALLQGSTQVAIPSRGGLESRLTGILTETRQLGWRAAEAFGLLVSGEGFASHGAYGRALELETQAIELAQEIQHRQWLAGATMLQGAVYALVLNFEAAQARLTSALALAHALHSMYWIHNCSGFLASAFIAQHELARASEILDAVLPPDAPAFTTGQRQVWAARAELALAQYDVARAHHALDVLLRDASNLMPDAVIPRLWILRAQAFMEQEQYETAAALLQAARTEAEKTEQPAWAWRALTVLAQNYRRQGNAGETRRAASDAERIVNALAETVPEDNVRALFVERAHAQIQET